MTASMCRVLPSHQAFFYLKILCALEMNESRHTTPIAKISNKLGSLYFTFQVLLLKKLPVNVTEQLTPYAFSNLGNATRLTDVRNLSKLTV